MTPAEMQKLLGFIPKQSRTNDQIDAHALAEGGMLRHHALAPAELAKGEMVCLFKAWSDPRVTADVGMVFNRFHQLTGSCVGAGGGNGIFSVIAVQRCIATAPTKAFVPWWPFNYGRSRLYMGDRGRGEGSLGSTFAKTIITDGMISASEPGLPKFSNADGLTLTSALEMAWSDGDSSLVMDFMDEAKPHPLGSAAIARNAQDLKTGIINGYPFTFACNNYIGKASIKGEGENACVVGYWDGRGGHQQSGHAYWNHPTLGPLFWIQNNWPGSTYPKDPAGGPVCGCWVTEAKVEVAFQLDAEVYILSHLNWFPAQPEVPEAFSWVF